jgi:DNA adenine methylase
MRPRPVLRYHGGKWLLAPWIISHFGPHRVYVEPFGGAASVLMRKKRSHVEIYNDQWETVVNVFRVLRDPVKAVELARMLHLTPFARDEFEEISALDLAELSDVERARCTVLRSLAGFGSASTNGAHVTGFRANSAASSTTPAIDWANYPAHISRFVQRLKGVVIENRNAVDVIRQHDSRSTLFYLDPPILTPLATYAAVMPCTLLRCLMKTILRLRPCFMKCRGWSLSLATNVSYIANCSGAGLSTRKNM